MAHQMAINYSIHRQMLNVCNKTANKSRLNLTVNNNLITTAHCESRKIPLHNHIALG